jgi:hypothetical protein
VTRPEEENDMRETNLSKDWGQNAVRLLRDELALGIDGFSRKGRL